MVNLDKSWKPIGTNILVRKDKDKDVTEGGIVLPDNSRIPVLTCIVLKIGPTVDLIACPIQQYDRILVKPKHATPVDFEKENKLYIIDCENIIAIEEIIRKDEKTKI